MSILGESIVKKESINKVTGVAKYTADFNAPGLLHAKMLVSPFSHAKIISIDISEAQKSKGVRAVITGQEFSILTGPVLEDRPILAKEKVRYYGEPVAIVVADSEQEARLACSKIKVEYEPLPIINSPVQAFQKDAPLIHEDLWKYTHAVQDNPVKFTNIANFTKVRKGDLKRGWEESEVIIQNRFSFPQSDHGATETRAVLAEILPNGEVIITTSSQAPYTVQKLINRAFQVDMQKIKVITPFVGGGFGGKASIQLEFIAFVASQAVGGRLVKLVNSREEDMISSPVKVGLEAEVKLGCRKDGKLTAIQITYWFDGGAYAGEAPHVTKSAALNCTGPYKIEHVYCDSYCMYTNHPYVTAFRGFGHSELTFPMERSMDLLAEKLNMDPLELRLKNAIQPGDSSPSQTPLNNSNLGNLQQCILRLKEWMNWNEGQRVQTDDGKIRAKGIGCFWKTSITPTNAVSGAIITFNKDGSVNLSCGVVEIGQGTKTVLAQLLAEKLKMDVDRIYVMMETNTEVNPEHWKTVASSAVYMAGNAVLRAAEDAIGQLRHVAAQVLRCAVQDLEVGNEKVYLVHNPQHFVYVKDIAHGYKYPDGNAIGGQIIGRGQFIMQHLTNIDPETGRGNPGPDWTVGAQGVEVEFDPQTFTYHLLKAVSVIDAGRVLNQKSAQGQVMGGMSMGLSLASREGFFYDELGRIHNNQFRTYKVMRYGENPEYIVDFVETPQLDAPYGARGIGEHGVIAMPAALANSLSVAAGVALNHFPLTPEFIWRSVRGDNHDSF